VQIVQRTETSFVRTGELEHPYPPTKIMWSPDKSLNSPDLLATTGDYLRLWSVDEQEPGGVKLHSLLNNNTNAEYCSPLTSFDWCDADPSTVGTSSIDTTCTIWDVATGTPKTQLIAHDKEVYDIAFARTKDIFASVGADGSVRMFDLRSLEHSTIIYETHDLTPLMRLSWNKQDPNYLATILTDSAKTVILDISQLDPRAPVRKGKWTPEEEVYTTKIINDFNKGLLPLAPGTTLRSYLSEKLNCDPMRITKKFAGASCIGKRVFMPVERTPENLIETHRSRRELEEMARKFHIRLESM
ncbi:unnamed protein product, partial [Ectocarpus sp. 13 AM-2016]